MPIVKLVLFNIVGVISLLKETFSNMEITMSELIDRIYRIDRI